MSGEDTNKLYSKKAFEIAYALFRVSKNIAHDDLSGYLESQALGLLNSAATGEYEVVLETLQAIEYFLRLGAEIGLIKEGNAQIIINEGRKLNSAIFAELSDEETDDNEDEDDLDLESIFSEFKRVPVAQSEHEERSRSSQELDTISIDDESENEEGDFVSYEELGEREAEETEEEGEEEESVGGQPRFSTTEVAADFETYNAADDSANIAVYSARMRQSAILDRIREGGHFRLKDLHKIMPNLSERTLRYDLQKLIERGYIERVGSGGPGSYYKAKG